MTRCLLCANNSCPTYPLPGHCEAHQGKGCEAAWSIGWALCLLSPGWHTPLGTPGGPTVVPRTTASTAPRTWPHTSLPVPTHSQRSHSSGPSHHMQPPPRCPGTGPTTVAQCPAVTSRSKQAGNEGESQTARTDQSVARGNMGQHITPLPPGWPPAPETWGADLAGGKGQLVLQ